MVCSRLVTSVGKSWLWWRWAGAYVLWFGCLGLQSRPRPSHWLWYLSTRLSFPQYILRDHWHCFALVRMVSRTDKFVSCPGRAERLGSWHLHTLPNRFGFIGGSTDASNLQALQACLVINISAAAGGLTWLVIDRLRQGVWSPVSFCSGVLVALIAATPGAGLVPASAGLAFGFISAVVCNYATAIKVWMDCDDALGKRISCQCPTWRPMMRSIPWPKTNEDLHFLTRRYLCFPCCGWLGRLTLDRHLCRHRRCCLWWPDENCGWMDQS